MNIANAGRRAVGGIIDLILLIIFIFVFSKVTGWGWTPAQNGGSGGSIHGWPFIFIIFIGFILFGLCEAATAKTPGKWIARTHVESLSGKRVSFTESIIRNLLRCIDIIFLYLVGFIVISCTEKNQRIGDLCAHTVVVNDSLK